MGLDPSIKSRLTERELPQFTGETLFDHLARAVCAAGCLPRKELYESWEVARRTRRRFRGGRVVDLAAGHGLLAYALLLLDDSSPSAVCVDPRRPANAPRLWSALDARWPRLAGRVTYEERSLGEVPLWPTDLVVSSHGCGGLTDQVLARAADAGARVVVLPCCHDVAQSERGGLDGWLDGPLAVDVTRAATLRARGYVVHTQRIPERITPKNRLLLGEPSRGGAVSNPTSVRSSR
jgi:hypothetical protein